MSPIRPERRAATHRRGGLGQRRPRRGGRRPRTANRPDRFSITHNAAGLRTHGPAAAGRRGGRGRDRTPRRPGRRRAAPGRADRLRDPTRPAEEPALALRLGRQQGRPVRRLRAGRRRAHRPAPAAPAAGRHRRPPPRCARPSAPAKTSSPTGSRWPTSCARTCRSASPARSACSPTSTPTSPCGSWNASPPPRRADWLSPKRWAAWLSSVGYCGRTPPETLHTAPHRRPRGAAGTGRRHRRRGHRRVRGRPAHHHHPDRGPGRPHQPSNSTCTPTSAIFTSLPRSGTVRAARLLAEIGDARGRFPTADSLACLAGVAPSTRQSGKIEAVTFRWGADKQLRDAICDFAGDSRHANPWAADLYRRARARGHDHPHAVRILARAWVDIIWACWTSQHPLRPRPTRRPPTHSSTKINRMAA